MAQNRRKCVQEVIGETFRQMSRLGGCSITQAFDDVFTAIEEPCSAKFSGPAPSFAQHVRGASF